MIDKTPKYRTGDSPGDITEWLHEYTGYRLLIRRLRRHLPSQGKAKEVHFPSGNVHYIGYSSVAFGATFPYKGRLLQRPAFVYIQSVSGGFSGVENEKHTN